MSVKPNVLLVVLDTARADACAPYVPDRDTPTFAQLASLGTAFPNAMAPSCWTVPSHGAMLMGGPPRTVGVCRIIGNAQRCVSVIRDQADRYMPEVFRRSGYQTAAVSANSWISAANGFSLGFEDFAEVTGKRVFRMAEKGLRSQVEWYVAALQAKADDGAEAAESLLDGWLSSRTGKPFFWFVNLIECHSPYLPPKPFADSNPIRRLLAARDSRRHLTFQGVLETVATGRVPHRRALQRMRRCYDASVVMMDRWLSRILERLDSARVLDDTIVVVTSDHGENFGEGSLIGHAGSLDDRLLRVPLIAAGPGVEKAPSHVVGLDSLARRLGDLAGIGHPWEDRDQTGVAVAQYDGPLDLSDQRADEFIRRVQPSPDGIKRLTQPYTCATDGRWKLVRVGDESRLYDLDADPFETSPKPVGGGTPTIARLERALDDVAAEAQDESDAAPGDPMSPDLEARMRLLGYL